MKGGGAIVRIIKAIKKMKTSKKISLLIALVLTMAIVAIVPTLAWFSYQRKIATVTAVNAPSLLYINAAHNEDLINLDMDSIDVSPDNKDAGGNRITKKEFIFCVAGSDTNSYKGSDTNSYKLQLAFTTNNQFEYKLYHAAATDVPRDGALTYKTNEHNEYIPGGPVANADYNLGTQLYVYKTDSVAITGTYKNDTNDAQNWLLGKTDDQYKIDTYSAYNKIEKHDMPVYWQTDAAISTSLNENKEFCHYYILEVSWEEAVDNDARYDNSNETDIIYITAKSSS